MVGEVEESFSNTQTLPQNISISTFQVEYILRAWLSPQTVNYDDGHHKDFRAPPNMGNTVDLCST